MSLVVEQNIALDPGDVGFLCAQGVVLAPHSVTDLIQQLLGALFHLCPPLGGLLSELTPRRLAIRSLKVENRYRDCA